MTTAAQGDPPPEVPLGPLLGTLPADLLQAEVLRRLGPTHLASLAGAGRVCTAAVAATALMQWAKHAKGTAPGYFQRMCVRGSCSQAAHCGNREVLEWLHDTGFPWDAATCRMAARSGHLEVPQWARENGCLWGHLEVPQWARENGCLWHYYTCLYAADAGQLEVLGSGCGKTMRPARFGTRSAFASSPVGPGSRR